MKLSLLAVLVLLPVMIVARADAGSLGAAEMQKLHPALQSLVRSRAATFHGFPVFDAVAPGAAQAGVIVYTRDAGALRAAGISVQAVHNSFVTARVRTEDLETLARLPQVQWVDPGSVNTIQTDESVPETGARLLQGGFLNSTPYTGRGAIVVIYDTGIDWKHLDFRDPADPSKTRILAIWDQTLTPAGAEASPAGLGYGVEYTKAQIENELGGSPPGFVREKDTNGHGTHVAGIALGNGLTFLGKYTGMAPGADIVVVKGGNGSFSEADMVNGIQYASNVAAAYAKPLVLNWSIGGQTGPHDGTRNYEVAVNSFVATPGRVVCIAAGNDGSGLIHKGGLVPAGATDTVRIMVPAYSPKSGADNDAYIIDSWLRSNAGLSATAVSPNGVVYVRPADQSGTAPNASDGTIDLYNYISPLKGNRNIQLYVHDAGGAPVPAVGTWLLVLSNPTGIAQTYDLWITLRSVGSSSVTVTGADNNTSVAMPGTAEGAITVASYVTKWSWPSYVGQYTYNGSDRTGNISTFSSLGPTADGRLKPEIAAPGQGIVSALSTTADTTGASSYVYPGRKHWIDQGTSMASPHVTGAAALLLGVNPSLTASQIKTLLQNTANVDAFTSSVPNSTWGSGKLDVLEAMAGLLSSGAQVVRTTVAYDSAGPNAIVMLTGTLKMAMRFTAPAAGQATGVLVNLTTPGNDPIVGTGNLLCEIDATNGSMPGTRLGSVVSTPIAMLNPGTLNYVQISGAGATLNAGTDYCVVLSLSNSTDTVKVRADRATTGNRSAVFDGTTWGSVGYNLRTRVIVTSSAGTSSVAEETGRPFLFALEQNYPNPFNPSTRISFTIPKKGAVHLTVYDILGKEIKTLVNGEQSAGGHQVEWKGTNNGGMPVASGVYFCRLESAGMTKTSKMMLVH